MGNATSQDLIQSNIPTDSPSGDPCSNNKNKRDCQDDPLCEYAVRRKIKKDIACYSQTKSPSASPTETESPTNNPSDSPTNYPNPTASPTETESPTDNPSDSPTGDPCSKNKNKRACQDDPLCEYA